MRVLLCFLMVIRNIMIQIRGSRPSEAAKCSKCSEKCGSKSSLEQTNLIAVVISVRSTCTNAIFNFILSMDHVNKRLVLNAILRGCKYNSNLDRPGLLTNNLTPHNFRSKEMG